MPKGQKRKAVEGQHIVCQFPKYKILQFILIFLRLLPAASVICFVLLFQHYICPRIMIREVRRYFSCIVNLVCLRIVLLLLGFCNLECQSYRYFQDNPKVITFRSGWVGVASHQTIIDFLYYSYLFNPTYARIIEFIDDQSKPNIFYTPLSFSEAFLASLSYRGFDPIVLRGQQQFKRFKRRKLLMPTLTSECAEESKGPILLFLPSLGLNQQVSLHKIVGQDIFDNQYMFNRSGIVFDAKIQQNKGTQRITPEFTAKIYLNQLILVAELCKQLKANTLTITAIQTIKKKYEYTRESYSYYVDKMYQSFKITTLNLSFSHYLTIFNEKQKQKEEPKKDEKQNVKCNKNVNKQKKTKLNRSNRKE